MAREGFGAWSLSGRRELNRPVGCLVPLDHIPRFSWPLFRAKAILNDCSPIFHSRRYASTGSRSDHRMRSSIHPQARTTPKIRQEIKDSGLSDREAANVFNITRATAAKWLKRDDVHGVFGRSPFPKARLRRPLTTCITPAK